MYKNVIYYSQCWEDPSVVTRALSIESNDIVLSVTSGGDNSLAILSEGCARVLSIDSNPAQNHLLELKYTALQRLTYDEYLAFVGVRSSEKRTDLFGKLQSELSPQAQEWWSNHEELISSGIIHCGRFDTYVRYFAQYVIPLIHGKKTIQTFISIETIEDQWKFYKETWNSYAWRFMFEFATKRQLLMRARHEGMFAQVDKIPTSKEYVRRLERNISSVSVRDNYFMHYCLNGSYSTCLPLNLEEKSYLRLREIVAKNDSRLEYVSQDLLSYLRTVADNTFTKFNLSDIFEALSLDENNKIWDELVRTAKPGARVVYWNNLVKRTFPAYLTKNILSDEKLEDELRRQDRVYFYDTVYTHIITK